MDQTTLGNNRCMNRRIRRPEAENPCRQNLQGLNALAEWTGLEPATPGVTGRYSNQLNYHSAVDKLAL